MSGGTLALMLGVVLAPAVLLLLRALGTLDVPNERSSHSTPVVRGAGVAPAIAATAAVLASKELDVTNQLVFAVVPLAFGVVGLGDDVRAMSPVARLVCQAVLTAALMGVLASGGQDLPLVAAAVCVVWVIGFVNVVNFMDGINGLAIGQVLAASLSWWWLARVQGAETLEVVAAIGGMAVVGLIPFNFPAARMFLGDVGSYFYGSWLAAVVVVGALEGASLVALLLPLLLFLLDTGTTILRRLRNHEALLTAHRDHAYQRLARSGLGSVGTTIVTVALIAAAGAMGPISVERGAFAQGVAVAAALTTGLAYVVAGVLFGEDRPAGRRTSRSGRAAPR